MKYILIFGIKSKIKYFLNFVITTEKEKKFGIYHKDSLKPKNDKNEYNLNCKDVFYFHLIMMTYINLSGKKIKIN